MKKNLLIISYTYPPLNDAGAQRPYALAKFIDKTKYNVYVIICENPNAPLGINPDFNPEIKGVEVIRIKSLIGSNANGIKNNSLKNKGFTSFIKKRIIDIAQSFIWPDKGMFWYPNVKSFLKENKTFTDKIDIVFSTAPGVTNHRIAKYIKSINSEVKWIADYRDFNYVNNWENKPGIKSLLYKNLEYKIIKEADHLTFVTKTMLDAYINTYPKYFKKMHAIYNGFDPSDVSSSTNILSTDKLVFFYAGSFYNGIRSPLPLLELLDLAILNKLLKLEEIDIKIAGNIDEETKLLMKDFKSFECVTFMGNIPRSEVIKNMSNSTFLWLIVGNIKSHYETIPIKLFEYISARRPIVNFAPIVGESSLIIEEKGLGYNFDTLNYQLDQNYLKLVDLISKYKNNDFTDFLPYENLQSFTWETKIGELEKIMETNE